jgi:hypothetical protein
MADVREIGLNEEGSDGSFPLLRSGRIMECFHEAGMVPCDKDWFKSLYRRRIEGCRRLWISLHEMSSIPGADPFFQVFNGVIYLEF